ncbi:hypothetical protein BDB00DRAFT_786030 [Zychaea mexicana]|uniref:uncharacterized protein n=1 Tax=Zychaea mexicana TaxID=64656 RepID=UPI0022FEA9AD|nr:uncharacterized protein BDB00DRAFT_786030 [Zychaea mexicana]KAI9495790.1 hypothetical protein BDB00DRAFT_786030 [Zychaea mexicana]
MMKLIQLSVVLAVCFILNINAQQPSAPAGGAGIAITSPALGTVWTAGKTEKVSWTIQDNTVTEISTVELRNGGSANLQMVGNVGSKIPVSGGQWDWAIPVTTKTDASYVLVFKSNKGDTYSPYFTIMAAPPGTVANATASASTTGSGTAPGASATPSGDHSGASTPFQLAFSLVGGLSVAAAALLI